MFKSFPNVLQSIINDNLNELQLVELYDNFYKKYGNIFNIKINKTNITDVDFEIVLQKLYDKPCINILNCPEINIFYENVKYNGKYIDEYHDDDPEIITNIYDKKNKLCFPDDLKLFYKMFSFYNKNKCDFINFKNIYQCESMLYANNGNRIDGSSPHYEKDIYFNDWYTILYDSGELYINLNPNSKEYENIYSYSSSIDCGFIGFVCKSFTKLIKKILNENIKLKSYSNSKSENTDDTDDICVSICDHFNEFCECKEN